MHPLLRDVRYALRASRRNLAATLIIVASVAIGIGANTAIFSVVNALLLKPLPYPDPARLVVLWLRAPGINIPQDWPSPGQYIDIKTANRSFDEMSISRGVSGTLLGVGQPERVEALLTSSSLFHLLGARPLYGRLLAAEDDVPGTERVAVLSHAFWTRLFNADPAVVGRSITLNGVDPRRDTKNLFTVVGVLGRDFLLNDEVMPTVGSIRQMDVFLPLPFNAADAATRRGDENYNVMARLRSGVTVAQAQADISVIAANIRDKDKRDRTFTISVVPLLDQVVGDVRRTLLVLLGSVALVLLIACANVAGLMLTRAGGRQREAAIRTALGADWWQLVRQLLTESVVLSLLGGAAGLVLAHIGLYLVRTINPGNIPRLDVITLDGTVLGFTAAVSILTGLLFGLAPALRLIAVDLNTSLKAGGRTAQHDGGFHASRRHIRNLLVVAEIAVSIVLLVGAGLLVRSFVRLQGVSPGFNADHVITMRLGTSGRQFNDRSAAVEASRQFGEKIAAVPGVRVRGAITALPFTSSVGWGTIRIEGYTPPPGEQLQVDQRVVTPDYFRTMEIPLVQGRAFTDFDAMPDAQRVAIVDEKFAKRIWPTGNALGKRLGDPKQPTTIVGVVGTVKQYGLDIDGRIVVYRPSVGLLPYQVARAASDPASTAATIVRTIHEADPTVPVYDVRTMDDRMHASLARQRFSMLLLGAFALFALGLAMIGVYGVMSHLVAQGTHDIGVRMALGAERRRIIGMVMQRGFELTASGLALGLVGAALVTRVMASLLFGVSPTDWVTFLAVPFILAAVGLLACYLPARRATTVDPVVALREE